VFLWTTTFSGFTNPTMSMLDVLKIKIRIVHSTMSSIHKMPSILSQFQLQQMKKKNQWKKKKKMNFFFKKKPWTLTYILVLQTICYLWAPFSNLDQLNFPSKLKCHLKLTWISFGSSYKVPQSNLCDWSILLDPHLNYPWDNKNDNL